MIQLLEEQLAHSNKQNNELTNKLNQSLKQIDVLTEQVRQLTKALYGSKSEKSKYQQQQTILKLMLMGQANTN